LDSIFWGKIQQIFIHEKKIRTTIIVRSVARSNWFDVIGELTIADAILDRLLHASYRVELNGESLRKKTVILSVDCVF